MQLGKGTWLENILEGRFALRKLGKFCLRELISMPEESSTETSDIVCNQHNVRKPENVLLTVDGTLKIADFGISILDGWVE